MAARDRRSKFNVMVAEHIDENRTLICNMVEELNCVAVPVASAAEIRPSIRDHRVDLILLDLDLGPDKVRKADTLYVVKQIAPLLPVVVMGRVMTPVLFRRLCTRGAQSFLQKPVDLNQLAATIFRNLL